MSDMQMAVPPVNPSGKNYEFIQGADIQSAIARIEIERRRERRWLAKALDDCFERTLDDSELESLIKSG